MHDPRTSPTLRTLAALTGDPPPGRWDWSVGRLDDAGRLSLRRGVVERLGSGPLGVRWHHLAVIVAPASDHRASRGLSVDARGRILVPTWVRHRGRDVLVGLEHEGPRLLIAPVEVLDRFGDVLAGQPR